MSWNILYDIALEDDAAYFDIAELVPALTHLQPPQAMLRIRVERSSAYHKTPELYGLTLSPAWAYCFVYPYPEAELMDLA